MSALEGLKILDFSTLLPGPYATMMLADMGADVLKVSSPQRADLVTNWGTIIEGTQTTAVAAWLGRNKKTIHLNLKKKEAIDVVKKLIMDYDIVMEQFRPGVMKKLGLDYETLKEVNPKLIYCSLTGYGQTGELAMRAGHDINYLARSGNMAASGRKNIGPVLTNMQVADVAVGSMNSIASILSAVIYRTRTGKGQYIDVSMLDGLLPFNSMDGAEFLLSGNSAKREEQLLNGGGIYDFYETSDGEYMSVGSLEPKFFAKLCEGTGFPEWADGEILKKNMRIVKESLKKRFREKTKSEWIDIFKNLDACVEPVMTMDDVCNDQHIKERGLLPYVPINIRNGGLIQQLGCPLKLSECAPEYKHAGYPEGWNTVDVLKELGLSDEEITYVSK